MSGTARLCAAPRQPKSRRSSPQAPPPAPVGSSLGRTDVSLADRTASSCSPSLHTPALLPDLGCSVRTPGPSGGRQASRLLRISWRTGVADLLADHSHSPSGEPMTFSLRGRTTASHPLSTSASSNTAAPSEREIPHAYPSFRATSHAMHLDHPRSRPTPGRARPGAPGAGLPIRRACTCSLLPSPNPESLHCLGGLMLAGRGRWGQVGVTAPTSMGSSAVTNDLD
ncbi:hypothetical protein EV644_14714 [Kribbella orskensis]|uniref:Uncharacterized protein n=1 Tax=Kribbella orskensis TaxID=2512216 RepID=A0ABY2B6K3_9ACTN|nr:hypothetical protein EV644_14714 [Kribbella orskensis]